MVLGNQAKSVTTVTQETGEGLQCQFSHAVKAQTSQKLTVIVMMGCFACIEFYTESNYQGA